jgi:dihydrolipoamide dehydrogenase
MAENFDVVVVGAGPAGYVAAIRAAQLKQKVAIVDKQWLGGVCLNVGCIPSKSLLRNAEIAHILRERGKDFGFSLENLKLDYGVALKRSRQNSDRLVKGVGFLMKKNSVTVYMAEAKFTAKDTLVVTDKDGKATEIKFKNAILATGATAMVPGAWKVDGQKVVTYMEAILQEKLPKSVVIIGSGAVGVEFATVWSSYGVEVTIVEMLPRLVPLEDEEVSNELRKAFDKRGIKLLLGSKINERGFVEINEKMQTSVPGIYAIGDVTGKLMLAHVGSAMGIIAAENIAGAETITLDYEMMPRATYCQPQIASFGLTEAQAREKGYSIKIGRFPFQANGKALGMGDYAGWVKLVMDEKYGELLGAHMIGPEVTELLPELTLAHMMELTPHEIARNVHAHPTLSESLMEAAHAAEGMPINI